MEAESRQPNLFGNFQRHDVFGDFPTPREKTLMRERRTDPKTHDARTMHRPEGLRICVVYNERNTPQTAFKLRWGKTSWIFKARRFRNLPSPEDIGHQTNTGLFEMHGV